MALSSYPHLMNLVNNYRPPNPSLRTPKISTHNNDADKIERFLQQDGHQTWGFVVYRCTYESDDKWNEFLVRFRAQIRSRFEFYNGLDIMDKLDMTVFDDKSLFDGATTSTIREHFKQWTATAPRQEQNAWGGLSQRYNYCIQVDHSALNSVLQDDSTPDRICHGWVNLIWKDWDPNPPRNDWDGGQQEEDEEPLEGCTKKRVGWMMVYSQSVMTGIYCNLRDFTWEIEYRRPPEVLRD